MKNLTIPLSEKEEAILQLMKRIYHLEHEVDFLKQRVEELTWKLEERGINDE